MNIWSRRAVISQTYQGMQTFLESPQLDEKNMSINRLTNRPCFPSIFDVSTMLLCTVLKFMPVYIYIYIYVGEEKQTEYEDKALH